MKVKTGEKTRYETRITRYWKDGTKISGWYGGKHSADELMKDYKSFAWFPELEKVTCRVREIKTDIFQEFAPCGDAALTK